MILLATIPYPPSVNKCWRRSGARIYVHPDVIKYREQVQLLMFQKPRFGASWLSMEMMIYPPDKRRRDIDNVLKVSLDALQKSGIYNDDFQIQKIYVERLHTIPSGSLEILIRAID